MTVRRQKRRDPETGTTSEFWMVDVSFRHPDGRRQRVRRVSPVQTRRGAEKYERELRHSLLAGTYGREEEEPIPTVREFAREFLDNYARANNKPSEVCAKERMLRCHLLPAFGHVRLDAVGSRAVESFKARKLREGLAPKTVNNLLVCLNKMLQVALDWEVIPSTPRIKPLKVPKPDFDFLDFEEAERLVAVAHTAELETMIVTALNTGLRIGELCALQWDDVDLVAGRLVVRRNLWAGIVGTPKSGRYREIPLNARVLQALKAHRHLRGAIVFCKEDGTHHTRMQGYRPLQTACKRAGLRRVTWHVLRHTFASHLVMRGVPLKSVQELLGHASMEMTMRYAHLSPDVRRDAVSALLPSGWQHSGNGRVPVTKGS